MDFNTSQDLNCKTTKTWTHTQSDRANKESINHRSILWRLSNFKGRWMKINSVSSNMVRKHVESQFHMFHIQPELQWLVCNESIFIFRLVQLRSRPKPNVIFRWIVYLGWRKINFCSYIWKAFYLHKQSWIFSSFCLERLKHCISV